MLRKVHAELQRPWVVLLRVVGFVVACAVVLAFSAPFGSALGRASQLFTGATGGIGAFALTLLFVRWDRNKLRSVGVALERLSVVRFVGGISLGAILIGVWAALSTLCGHVQWERDPNMQTSSVLWPLAGYAVLAAREELAFRGYPLRRLADTFGAVLAQAIVALLFALEHRIGGASWSDALIGAGTGSLAFGVAALTTGGLAVPIGMHTAWNFGHWSLGLKGGNGIWRPVGRADAPGAYQTAMLLYVLVMSSAAALLWWLRRQRDISRGRP